MSIPNEIIELVREKTSIVELLEREGISVKRSGKSFVALCPFHGEKTPSFNLSEEQGLYHCFGCGEKGDVFTFLQKLRGYSFLEAVRYLASRAGIKVPENDPGSREFAQKKKNLKKALLELNGHAQAFFKTEFDRTSAREAREYLQERGVGDELAKTFGVGWSPAESGRLRSFLTEQLGAETLCGFDVSSLLLTLGLLREHDAERDEEASVYEMFRARLMFPIMRSDAVVLAFGGRTLSKRKDIPKYINSPESPVYQKRSAFFGLPQALSVVRKTRSVYLVEGYMDVISMHCAGLPGVLAACGTAVCKEHAELLRRFADRVCLVFDGDAAGRKAAASCFPVFLNTGVELEVVVLAPDEDPDSLARSLTPQKFQDVLYSSRRSIMPVYVEQMRSELSAAGSSTSGQSVVISGKLAERLAGVLAQIVNPVERELRIREAADCLGVSVSSLDGLVIEELRRRGKASKHFAAKPAERLGARHFKPSSRLDPAIEPFVTSKGVEKESRSELESIHRQLLVAVLCEPSLAKAVLDLPSIVDGGLEVNDGEESKRLRRFIVELAEADFPPVTEWDRAASDSAQVPVVDEVRQFIEAHGYGSWGLIEEARRQSRIGGSKPTAVVSDGARMITHRALRDELELIRKQEAEEADSLRLAELAQQKLNKRRELEILREKPEKSG